MAIKLKSFVLILKFKHHQVPVASAVQGNHHQQNQYHHHIHQTNQMSNMAVGVTNIQGTGPGISHGTGAQHNMGISGNQPGTHLHGVMSNEEERKVLTITHIVCG